MFFIVPYFSDILVKWLIVETSVNNSSLKLIKQKVKTIDRRRRDINQEFLRFWLREFAIDYLLSLIQSKTTVQRYIILKAYRTNLTYCSGKRNQRVREKLKAYILLNVDSTNPSFAESAKITAARPSFRATGYIVGKYKKSQYIFGGTESKFIGVAANHPRKLNFQGCKEHLPNRKARR